MTTVYRAAGTLSNPDDAGYLPPSLGSLATDVVARYHAQQAVGASGDALTSMYDSTGTLLAGVTSGTVKVGTKDGLKVIDLSTGSADNRLSSPALALPKTRTLAMSCHLTAHSTVASQQILRGAGTQGTISVGTDGKIGAYGTLWTTYPKTAAAVTGWMTIIAIFDDDDTGSIVVNGVETTGALTYAGTPASAPLDISCPYPATNLLKVREWMAFDRDITSAEALALHGVLAQSIP